MAFAFDTLGYAKKLRDAGIPQPQAEAHAEAAREFIMAELVTKPDLTAAVQLIDTKIETLTLRLTVRLGVMLAAAVAALAALDRIVGS